MSTETILVPAEMPAVPLVLADATFLVALAGVEAQVASLKVTDAATAQEAANLLSRLTTAGRGLETTREELKKPFLQIGRKIDETARLVSLRIGRSKDTLSASLAAWNDAERKRLEAERRKRDEELLALQRKQEQEQREAEEHAAALAAKTPKADALDFDFEAPAPAPKSETEQRIEQLKYAPTPVAQKPTGVGFRKILKFRVTDPAQLPDAFIVKVANEQLIRATYCVGFKDGMPVPAVPGVVFFIENTTVATGRGA